MEEKEKQALPENLLFIDTETTGREEEDRIFQLAFIFQDKEHQDLCAPPLPLSVEAMEATHYTNKDVEDKPKFQDVNAAKVLLEILENENTVFVAHNAPFDIAMLEKEGVKTGKFIDTLKIAQHLDPDGKLGAYRLQYLRYALNLEVKDARAHDAMGDVKVLKALFERLYKKLIQETGDKEATIQKMIELSSMPIEIKKFTFGKHKDKTIEQVAMEDRGYLEWLLKEKQKELNEQGGTYNTAQTQDWIYTLEKYV